METPTDDRPAMLCLVALPGILDQKWPRAFCVVNLLDLPNWERWGWTFVALDPSSEAEWLAWRKAHPEAM